MWELEVDEKWKHGRPSWQIDGFTHIVLDVQVAASFEQDTHNLNVAFVGSQMQGASAILWIQNTHNSAQSAHNISTQTSCRGRQSWVHKPTTAVPHTESQSSGSDITAAQVTVVIACGLTEDNLLQSTIHLSNDSTENKQILNPWFYRGVHNVHSCSR